MRIELENALNEFSKMEGGFMNPQRESFNAAFVDQYINGSDIDRLSIANVAIQFGWQWCADTQEFDV